MWVNDNVLNHIIGETNTRALWIKLEQLYMLEKLEIIRCF